MSVAAELDALEDANMINPLDREKITFYCLFPRPGLRGY